MRKLYENIDWMIPKVLYEKTEYRLTGGRVGHFTQRRQHLKRIKSIEAEWGGGKTEQRKGVVQ